MVTKAWYESKLVWVNALSTIVAVLTMLSEGSLVPAESAPWVLFGVGVLNLVLRIWFTNTPIG